MKLQIYLIKQKLLKLFFKLSPILKFEIQEESMLPLLKPGNMVLVNKWSTKKINDLVVLKNPEEKEMLLVKRIKKIEKGKYFVIGDNLKKSRDSRHFGLVKNGKIVGKVFYILS